MFNVSCFWCFLFSQNPPNDYDFTLSASSNSEQFCSVSTNFTVTVLSGPLIAKFGTCTTLDLSAFSNSDRIKLDGSASYDSNIGRGKDGMFYFIKGIAQKKRKM